jgi:uncharacterized membrane protein YvbJ
MRCSSCGSENREGRKFCARCGAGLTLACGACGANNQPGERFCGECGKAMISPRTILAADDSSAIIETLDSLLGPLGCRVVYA